MARAPTDRDEAYAKSNLIFAKPNKLWRNMQTPEEDKSVLLKKFRVYIKPIPHKKVRYLVKSISSCPNGI